MMSSKFFRKQLSLQKYFSADSIAGAIYIVWLATAFILSSCANIGTPSGGPRDEDPPILVSANPLPGAVNVERTKQTLIFNELVNVKDAFSKVVVSPTSKSTPRVSSQGKRITIDFDSLQPNTTYTVDFGDAIEDNNENNKLDGFSYTFATGPTLDSLRISGRVLSARNLEPQQSILVGVTPNLADSAFTTTRLLRVAKTDDRGRFSIRGLAPGVYRVFALADMDNDYKYSSPEEDIAFYDFTVSPSFTSTLAQDTVWNKLTGEVDTVLNRGRTKFLPNDILLRTFNSGIRSQYLSKYERLDSTRVFLKFNTKADSLPKIKILEFPDIRSLGRLEASERLDSLVWWLSPELMRTDTLTLATTYLRTDSAQRLSAFADTLKFITPRAPIKKSKAKEEKRRILSEADSIAAITTAFSMVTGTQQEVHLPLIFETPVPLARFDTTRVRLSVMVDSTYRRVPDKFSVHNPDSLTPRRFLVDYPWEYGTKYKLEIDSLAGTDIYGLPTRPLAHEFSVKDAGEYCSILFHLTGLDPSVPAFVELLNNSDAVQRTAIVRDGNAWFPFLAPGKYFARVIEDYNGNGEFDTGNYEQNLQPDLAYYYPKQINLKKNWDKEETWAVFDTPVDMMKPTVLLKNKPAASSKRGKKEKSGSELNEEEEDYFDPNSNPFDPNDKSRRSKTKRIHN